MYDKKSPTFGEVPNMPYIEFLGYVHDCII